MVATVRALGEEFAGLLTAAVGLWWRLLPWLVGFGLVGWAGYYGSVLAGSEVALVWPWLVLGCLALGVVVQLAATVAALRVAVLRAGATAGADPAAGTPLRLLSTTALPFLAIIAAFGFVDRFARDVVVVVGQRYSLFGGAEFLSALNPLGSVQTGLAVAGGVAGLFVLRRVIEGIAGRTGWTWLGLVAALLEALFGLLVLLSGFRLVQEFWLWLDDRQLAAWWEGLVETLTGWISVPPVVADAWAFVAGSAWPVAWDLLSRPLAWLALTALVAGARRAGVRPAAIRWGAAGRVGREVFAADLDDKYLPVWHAVRFLSRAGWPLLGGFVLVFTVVDWAGELLTDSLITGLGPFTGAAAVQTLPFLDLVPQVLVLSLQFALLAVTAARAGGVSAGAPARSGLQAAVVGVVCVAVALSSLALDRDPTRVVTGGIEQPLALPGQTVTVHDPRAGTELVEDGDARVPTELAFVVVPVTVEQERTGGSLTAELVAGRRTYRAWDGPASLFSRPGFGTRRDLAFEVDPADLAGGLVLRVVPGAATSNGALWAEVPLPGLAAAGPVGYDSLAAEWAR